MYYIGYCRGTSLQRVWMCTRLLAYRVTHLVGENLLLTQFRQFWQLLGRYGSYLLPRHDSGTSQFQINRRFSPPRYVTLYRRAEKWQKGTGNDLYNLSNQTDGFHFHSLLKMLPAVRIKGPPRITEGFVLYIATRPSLPSKSRSLGVARRALPRSVTDRLREER